jgi:hypothetical protein
MPFEWMRIGLLVGREERVCEDRWDGQARAVNSSDFIALLDKKKSGKTDQGSGGSPGGTKAHVTDETSSKHDDL